MIGMFISNCGWLLSTKQFIMGEVYQPHPSPPTCCNSFTKWRKLSRQAMAWWLVYPCLHFAWDSLPFFMTGIEWESEPKWCNFATKPCMGSVTRFMDVYLKYLQFLLPILGFLFRGCTTGTGINQNFRFQSVWSFFKIYIHVWTTHTLKLLLAKVMTNHSF